MAILIDTNILIYTLDTGAPERQEKSLALLSQTEKGFIVSTQVLQEFYAVATRKRLLAPNDARRMVVSLMEWMVVPTTPQMVADAIDTSIGYQISLWDALIVEAAHSCGCKTVWTEDMQHGQTIRGVRIVNPFL